MSHDLARYHRQMLLPGFGDAGQRKLGDSTALVLGCGALGSMAADMLARAGVGHLVIVDRDFVELTNLQRQVLFDESDAAGGVLPKAIAARRRLARVNSEVRVTPVVDDLDYRNIERLAIGADVLLDGLDNFETRYLANDVAVSRGIPYLYGAAVGTGGMAFAVLPHSGMDTPWERHPDGDLATPCLRCLFGEAPASGSAPGCDTVGVLGSAVGVIAQFQVAEALKVLTGQFDRVSRSLLHLDLWANEIMPLKVDGSRDQADCPCCRHRRFDYLQGRAGSSATSLCGRDAVQLRPRGEAGRVDFDALAARLRGRAEVDVNDFMLRARLVDRDQPFEISLFPNGRAIIRGTDDAGVARGIYAKYIGI